ncbi:MAG TPA: lysophospholipid acyltransferase family protein [Spirochaetota bacterium]|nr:lysophospholipid acyltransferase family protein [Spirochaetota bacterium]
MLVRIFRIIIFTFSMHIVTHLIVFFMLPFGLLIVRFNGKKLPGLKRWFRRALFRIVGKDLEVHGEENIEKVKGYLIVANYPSFYAGFVMVSLFPMSSIVAHSFTSRIPILGHILKRSGAIFVNPKRAQRSRRSIEMGIDNVTGSVIIFPEGKRTPDGEIKRFKRGYIYILRHSWLDLLPVSLNGLYSLKPVKRFYLDPDAEPEVFIHRAISNSRLREMSDQEIHDLTVDIIRSEYRP